MLLTNPCNQTKDPFIYFPFVFRFPFVCLFFRASPTGLDNNLKRRIADVDKLLEALLNIFSFVL